MVSKYVHLMLQRAFPDKGSLVIDFTDGVVAKCDVPIVKILL